MPASPERIAIPISAAARALHLTVQTTYRAAAGLTEVRDGQVTVPLSWLMRVLDERDEGRPATGGNRQ